MKRSMLIVLICLAWACSRETSESAPPPPAAPLTAQEASPSEAKEPTAEQVPVPADFADEARAAITQSNYKAELAALTQEIESDAAR